MSKLSVIIPVYNGEKTVDKCLDSIINSLTDQNVEIICIDDGSKDNSWEILQKYEEMKIKINPKYEEMRSFIERIPDVFEQDPASCEP